MIATAQPSDCFEIHSRTLSNAKIRRAIRVGGPGAFCFCVELLAWCSRHRSDGFVPGGELESVGEHSEAERAELIDALRSAGLIDVQHDGSVRLLERDLWRLQP